MCTWLDHRADDGGACFRPSSLRWSRPGRWPRAEAPAAATAARGGSATSGDITWWGWTPTVQGEAAYIKAFNKVYPDIHITFKEITIAGYDAAMRPALAVSGVGPDIFGIAPGAGLALYAPDAINLEPAIAKALGPDWKSKLAPIGPGRPDHREREARRLADGSSFAGTCGSIRPSSPSTG